MPKNIIHNLYIYIITGILTAVGALTAPMTASAFPTEIYADSSALSTGKWVKISVESSGMHLIPTATLRSWGFNDPAKVRIHGYGGRRIADLLSAATYVDDLPETPSVLTSKGVAFYAAGPLDWDISIEPYYHGSANTYSKKGYYFVTESDSPRLEPSLTGVPGATSPATTAQGRTHHESELVQATISGPLFVGEDFKNTRRQNFNITTPGRVEDTDVWMECMFFHNHPSQPALLTFTVDGTTLPEVSSDRIPATSSSNYAHGSVSAARHIFRPDGTDAFKLGVSYTPGVSSFTAHLDYLSFNYTRRLTLPAEGHMEFWSKDSQLAFTAASGLHIWDVTNPAAIMAVNSASESGRLVWTATEGNIRAYVAWSETASMPSPSLVEEIANQNIHGETTPADMIIITPAELNAPALRIADLHRTQDSMKVVVIDQEKIYNEFSSGTYDIGGLRKYLKYAYDISADSDSPLKYVLLLGRTTLDHREIIPNRPAKYRTTPWWVVREPRLSMTDNDGYGTDDFIAMLEDESGKNLGLDRLSVAVGRIPMLTVEEGHELVDKLYQYVNSSKKTGWKNRMIVLADDGDSGEHLRQAENMSGLLTQIERQQNVIDKIYIDAYQLVNGTYPDARTEMFRLLDDGVAWWVFTGHANDHSWTGEGMLTYTDINNMYLSRLPFVLASTCDFLRWDGNTISGGEIMYKERNGGCIAMISATRPVYISDNGLFLKAFGRQALSRDEKGHLVRSGEAYRRTKNDIRNNSGNITSNTNRLRFVFMGDPAMAIATPSNIIEVTSINGIVPNDENQVTIGALSNTVIEGRVVDPSGALMTDFSGVVSIDIFDSDYSVTTLGHNGGTQDTYDRHGTKLFSGSAPVTNGLFKLTAPMPSQIADNFREATMSLYAYATNSNEEAVGLCREFFVYGLDEPAQADNTAPDIESLVLNHSGFKSGDTVNPSPLLIASISDNVGLNMSLAGIGQQMSLTLDTFTSITDVSSFFTPSTDGSPSGVINYPLEGLQEGAHTLTLRVFDTSGNASSRTIDFFVSEKVSPQIFELYTDANPASTSASFFVRHDRPNAYMSVTVTVYNLMGQPVWSGTSKGSSELNVSNPVTWDLCDSAGRRVQRGIYLYRASITTDDEHYETASRRIAVTAPQ